MHSHPFTVYHHIDTIFLTIKTTLSSTRFHIAWDSLATGVFKSGKDHFPLFLVSIFYRPLTNFHTNKNFLGDSSTTQ